VSLPTAHYRPLIAGCVFTTSLPFWRNWSPAVWLEALILQESGGNHKAVRYERHQDQAGRWDAGSDADTPDVDDGLLEDDKSYGLMQVMGYNARLWAGASGAMNFAVLLRPIANIACGLWILVAELEATHQNVARALARYNGGPTGDDLVDGEHMRRQVYVDGVASWAARVYREVP